MVSYKIVLVRKLESNLIFSLHSAKWNDNLKLPIVRIHFLLDHSLWQISSDFLSFADAIREKERELIAALQSQHQVNNNSLFNGHPSSGHSSPTHHLIDTNNNSTATTTTSNSSCSSALFYPPRTTITPPPTSMANATSNLDPNAQDFCLLTHSTTNN